MSGGTSTSTSIPENNDAATRDVVLAAKAAKHAEMHKAR